ncbi:MAG: hypothetical protein IJ835_01125 [Muribaculaceae bacterium]|nr:hypothetical protein [Muribaculaceae bacterium]
MEKQEKKSLLDTCVKHLNYEREDLATYDGRQRRDRATPRPPPSHQIMNPPSNPTPTTMRPLSHPPPTDAPTVPPPDCRVDACVDRVPQSPDTKSNIATRHGACKCPTNAGRRPDPINNPALRSASDAEWGRSQSKKPSPDGRPPFVPTHCPTHQSKPRRG